jgi:hypothetical protein
MTNFESMQELHEFLKVQKTPKKQVGVIPMDEKW